MKIFRQGIELLGSIFVIDAFNKFYDHLDKRYVFSDGGVEQDFAHAQEVKDDTLHHHESG
ncbi:MAG: hypothetical protein K0Q55_2845 [Verrucomicrobia bacterium]|nr:hypothetical protein [Verrucomicrobiota bacterium]